jgi:hypothetical protein
MIKQEVYVSASSSQALCRVYSYIEGQEHGYCLKEIASGNVYTDEVIIPQTRSMGEFEETGDIYVPPEVEK